MKDILTKIFEELNSLIEIENLEREEFGTLKIQPVEIQILGQMTLLANEVLAQVLTLQRTGDIDVLIKETQHFVKNTLKNIILPKYNLFFDEDSEKIWLPPKSRFEPFCNFKYVRVVLLDAESALVSKAVKAPKKNKFLVAEAIASNMFPNLIKRIEENMGNLKYFLEDENG